MSDGAQLVAPNAELALNGPGVSGARESYVSIKALQSFYQWSAVRHKMKTFCTAWRSRKWDAEKTKGE